MRAWRSVSSASSSGHAPANVRPAADARPARQPAAAAHGARRRPSSGFTRLARSAPLIGRGRAPSLARPFRGTLLTPWLSAGAGIVVAAGLALNVPHAELTYSPPSPGTNCPAPACGSAAPRHVPGKLAGTGTGIKLKPGRTAHGHQPAQAGAGPGAGSTQGTAPAVAPTGPPATPAHARQPASRHRAPVKVGYQTMRRWPAGFTALITITSRAALDNWRLAFRYPGVHIDSVAGARWIASDDDDGGVALAVPWPWGRPAGNQVRFLIIANGTPGQPAACRLDGAPCSFGQAADDPGWPAGGSG
jgi:Cellulose binding domain